MKSIRRERRRPARCRKPAAASRAGGAAAAAAAAAEVARAAEAVAIIVAGTAAVAPVEQHKLAAEALQHHLGRIAVLARLVGPFAGLDLALQIDLRALAQILFGDLAEILVEDDDAVPFGPLLAIAVAVLPILRRGDAQIDDFTAIVERTRFRIVAKIPDQNNLVHARHVILLPNISSHRKEPLARQARQADLQTPRAFSGG